MEKTWISKFLPKDEYREQRVLYFMAEAVVILAALLLIYATLASLVTTIELSGAAISFLAFAFIVTYITYRFTLTGNEYPDIATEKRFKKKKRANVFSSLYFLLYFLVVYTIIKGIPSNLKESLVILLPSLLAGTLFFVSNDVALKKSYKKNRELLDN